MLTTETPNQFDLTSTATSTPSQKKKKTSSSSSDSIVAGVGEVTSASWSSVSVSACMSTDVARRVPIDGSRKFAIAEPG